MIIVMICIVAVPSVFMLYVKAQLSRARLEDP